MSESNGNDQALSPTTVQDSVALSVQGQSVSVQDSLVGLVAGPEVCCRDSLIIVANAETLAGDTRVLVEGRSLVLAAATGAVLFAIARRLLRRRKG
jgi:hypothetical protein